MYYKRIKGKDKRKKIGEAKEQACVYDKYLCVGEVAISKTWTASGHQLSWIWYRLGKKTSFKLDG